MVNVKIIDKINDFERQKLPFYSFEFFPPKTQAGLQNLYSRIERMALLEPAFVDITWGTGGKSGETTLDMSHNIQKYFGLDVMMHLTCAEMTPPEVDKVLKQSKEAGLRNILALRGDPPNGKTWELSENGYNYGSDLTKHIRQNYQDYFGIAVGGYPEGHTESNSKEQCIQHLKAKVAAGADFVVTQLFYDLDEFKDFLKSCRAAGITCPIIPGIMPIHNYQRFYRFVNFCQIKVPSFVNEELEKLKHDDEKVRNFGVEFCVDMCRQLLNEGILGFHFYTLNLETSVAQVLAKLDISRDCRSRRSLPWRASTAPDRREETVRPIFWSNRPKSYIARTDDWDDFPNGRWGDSRSPTYQALNEYYLLHKKGMGVQQNEKKLLEWGAPESIDDISAVFTKYCLGEINNLPWCDEPVQEETSVINQELMK